MNLPSTPLSRGCLACIACAPCPHFISLVSGDRRMNPLIHLAISTITPVHNNEIVIVDARHWKYNYRSVFGCLLAYCNGVPRDCMQTPCWRCHGRGPFQGKDKKCDEQCCNQHFLPALTCLEHHFRVCQIWPRSALCGIWLELALFSRPSSLCVRKMSKQRHRKDITYKTSRLRSSLF